MKTTLSGLHDEIALYKQESLDILSGLYTDEQIHNLCTRYYKAAQDSTDLQEVFTLENRPPQTYFAVTALCTFMFLEGNIPSSPKYSLSAEHAANLILNGLNAVRALGIANWKPAEPYAEARLKMIKNQPKSRERNNVERDDILFRLDEYKQEKKVPPACLEYFLEYLGAHGYSIDRSKNKVNAPAGSSVNWKNPRSFSTIGKLLQNFRKDPS